ncbi:MAG: decarboxylase, partial [Nocardia sp.]|nr:decarboxylase [Nocardia sp.]
WGDERIIDLVTRAAHPAAEAVLLPETALHTDHLTPALTEAAGVPVLTATQVTVWSLFRALGRDPVAVGAGPLFGLDELR